MGSEYWGKIQAKRSRATYTKFLDNYSITNSSFLLHLYIIFYDLKCVKIHTLFCENYFQVCFSVRMTFLVSVVLSRDATTSTNPPPLLATVKFFFNHYHMCK